MEETKASLKEDDMQDRQVMLFFNAKRVPAGLVSRYC